MSMTMDDSIKRWTAKRKTALVIEIIQGKTTVAEASRSFDLSPASTSASTSMMIVLLQNQSDLLCIQSGYRKPLIQNKVSLDSPVQSRTFGRPRLRFLHLRCFASLPKLNAEHQPYHKRSQALHRYADAVRETSGRLGHVAQHAILAPSVQGL